MSFKVKCVVMASVVPYTVNELATFISVGTWPDSSDLFIIIDIGWYID